LAAAFVAWWVLKSDGYESRNRKRRMVDSTGEQ